MYAAHASLGEFSATSPWKVVGVSCGLCLAMMTGLSVMTVETNFDLLFMPRTSNTQKLKEFSVETFGPMPRPSVLLLRPAPDVDAPAGMLEKRLLSLAHQIHKEALGIKAPGGVGYDDVCIKLPSGKCITSTVFGYWKESESKMHADKCAAPRNSSAQLGAILSRRTRHAGTRSRRSKTKRRPTPTISRSSATK